MRNLLSLSLSALALLPAAAAASGLAYTRHVLPNGLTVLLHVEHSIPVTAVHIWYKVGSKHEQPGKTGFAHLFEHYMFKGSKNVPQGAWAQILARMGGVNNATTSMDRTTYFEFFPSEHLGEILRIESDRMAFLKSALSQEGLDTERGIVKNEKLRRYSGPFGSAWDVINDTVWPEGHPYKWTPIGSMDDLDAASLADVADFHSTHYLPNNAVLVVAGDHDPQETLAAITKWFAAIPAGPPPVAPVVPPLSAAPGRKERVVTDPRAPQPMLFLAYRIPGRGQPGWNEAAVLASILGGGRTSRLVQALRYDRQVALSVSAEVTGLHEQDLFLIDAMPAPGVTPAQLEAAINEEIARLIQDGVTQREMGRVKAGLRTARLKALQTAQGIAAEMAEGEAAFGAPDFGSTLDDAVRAMDAEGPRDAAARFLTPDNTNVITFTPPTGAQP